ncbi:Hpt domain-containing protein [Saliniramus sp.]|uniref:Hpt domain-containing protein n=1 Tax=Saliniramus sp. TaxID=2986772 RepID=UPI002C861A3A|nr:Hpt domain-containing protein [Saliniramus sp.]HMB10706.1 Hpt domain-containing protein [Saliniramus sp.]
MMTKAAAASERNMPFLDSDYLATATFDDEALARELLGLFVGQCDALAPVIAQEGGALQARIDAAHTLKGGARAIGACAVADAAERVEAGLRSEGVLPGAEWTWLEIAMQETRAVIARRGAL